MTNKTLAILGKLQDSEAEISVSLDLGLTETRVQVTQGKIFLPNGQSFRVPDSFDPAQNLCYFIKDGQVYPLQIFNQSTNFLYQLAPTSFRPILRISATQMHKKPFLDRLEKERLKGDVLDGGTGLGYSAIIAARTAESVVTVEWDPNVLEMASYNPHSRELFERENIRIIQEDITVAVKDFYDGTFDNIIQDGGMPKSSGGFFSQDHAYELYRVIKRGGKLYFYLPKKGQSKGRDFGMEQIKRMRKAGFQLIERDRTGSYAIFGK